MQWVVVVNTQSLPFKVPGISICEGLAVDGTTAALPLPPRSSPTSLGISLRRDREHIRTGGKGDML